MMNNSTAPYLALHASGENGSASRQNPLARTFSKRSEAEKRSLQALQIQNASIQKNLQRQRALAWYRVFLKEHEHRETSDVIGFMLRRVEAAQVKMSSASTGVHVQLVELCTLVRELKAIPAIPEFDVINAFVSEVETIAELGQTPDYEMLSEFFGRVESSRTHVLRTLEDKRQIKVLTIALCQHAGRKRGFTLEDGLKDKYNIEDASSLVVAAKEHVSGVFEQLRKDFGDYNVLAWIWGVLDQKLKEGDFAFLAAEWDVQALQELPWAGVGAIVMEAIEDSALTESDCKCFIGDHAVSFRRGVRKIHSDILPHFQLRLTQLKAVLDSQVAKSEQTKAKILAGLVTAGITLAQVLLHPFIASEVTLVFPHNGTAPIV